MIQIFTTGDITISFREETIPQAMETCYVNILKLDPAFFKNNRVTGRARWKETLGISWSGRETKIKQNNTKHQNKTKY